MAGVSFFKRLFYNWHVKLISLALAFILWKYVDTLNQKEKYLSVNLVVRNIPEGYTLTDEVPDYVKVVVKGKEEALSLLESRDLRAYVDLKGRYINEVRLPVEIDRRNLPKGVVIKDINPDYIKIKVEKIVEKRVDIVPVVIGKPAKGYILEDIEVTPKKVSIVGPQSILKKITSVYTEEIDISGIKDTIKRDVPIFVKYSKVKLVDINTVRVSIKVETRFILKDIDGITIGFRNLHEGLRIKNNNLKLKVKLKIPFYIKKDILPGDILAFVDCGNIDSPGSYRLQVEVFSNINGINIEEYEPKIVDVIVQK